MAHVILSNGLCLMSGPGDRGAQVGEVTVTRLLALAPLALRRGTEERLAERPGLTPVRQRGSGQALREIRPFADGDDPRHLDAAATARTGMPQVRTFHEERERTLLLIADFRRPMLWATQGRFRSVTGAERLAMEGWREAADGGSIGVAAITDAGIFGERPAPGARGMARVAGCLARAHAAARKAVAANLPTRPLSAELRQAARFAPRGAGMAVATGLDLTGEGWEEALAALSARGPVRFLLIEDSFERAPSAAPLPIADDAGHILRRGFPGLAETVAARAEHLRRPGITTERIGPEAAT